MKSLRNVTRSKLLYDLEDAKFLAVNAETANARMKAANRVDAIRKELALRDAVETVRRRGVQG